MQQQMIVLLQFHPTVIDSSALLRTTTTMNAITERISEEGRIINRAYFYRNSNNPSLMEMFGINTRLILA